MGETPHAVVLWDSKAHFETQLNEHLRQGYRINQAGTTVTLDGCTCFWAILTN